MPGEQDSGAITVMGLPRVSSGRPGKPRETSGQSLAGFLGIGIRATGPPEFTGTETQMAVGDGQEPLAAQAGNNLGQAALDGKWQHG